MAEQIVSPGVFQRETDQSFITPAPVEVGAAIVGPTVKGPVERPTVVTSFADLVIPILNSSCFRVASVITTPNLLTVS